MNVSSDDEPFADDDSSWEEGKMPPRRFQDDVPREQQSSQAAPPASRGKWSHPGPKMDIVKLGHTYPQIVPESWKTPNYPAPIKYSEKRPVPPPEPREREVPPEAHSFGPQFESIIRELSAILDPSKIPSTGIDELKMPPAKPIKREQRELKEPPEESITKEPPEELIKQVKEYVSSIPQHLSSSIPKPKPTSFPKTTTPSIPKPMPPAYKFAENYVAEEATPVGSPSSTPEPPANVAKENYNDPEAPSPPTDTYPQTKDVATDEAQIENDKKPSAVPSDKKVAEHPDSSNIIPSEVVVTTIKTRTLAPVIKAKTAPPRPGGHRFREPRFRDPDGHRYNVDYTRPPQSYVEAHPSRRRQQRREEAMAAYVKAEGLELEGEYATTPDNGTPDNATSVTGSEPKGTRLPNVVIPEQQVIVKDRRPKIKPTKLTPKLPLAVNRGRLVPSRECVGIEPQNQMYSGRRIAVDTPGFKPGDELIIIEEQQESLKSQPTLVASEGIQAPQQKVNEDVKQAEDQEREQKDPSVRSDLKNYDSSENLPLKQQPETAASGEEPEEPEEPCSKGLDHDRNEEPLDKRKEEYKAQFMKYIEQEVGALQDKLAQLGMTAVPKKKAPTTQPPVQERLLQELELERQREQLEYDALMKQVDEVLMQATATVATDPHDNTGMDAPAAQIESFKRTTNLDLYEMEHQLTQERNQQDRVELTKVAAYDRILRKWLSARAEQPRSHQTLDRILRKWLKKQKRESFPSDESPYDESPIVTSATQVSYSDLIERLQEVENGVFPVTKGNISERRQKPERDIVSATPEYIPFRRHEPKRVVAPATTRDSAQIQGLPRSRPTKFYDLPTRAESSASSMPPYRRTIDAILQAEPRVHSRKSLGEQQHALASSFDEKERGAHALKSTVSLGGGGDRWRQVLTASNSLLL